MKICIIMNIIIRIVNLVLLALDLVLLEKYHKTDAEIIVVGGGLSGIMAAYTILEREPTLEVMVLEASGRIGGRTSAVALKIDEVNYSSFDIGGHWISTRQIHMMNLIKKLNLEVLTRKVHGMAFGHFQNKTYMTLNDPPLFGGTMDKIQLIRFFAFLENLGEKVTFRNPTSILDWEEYDRMTMDNLIQKKIRSHVAQDIVRNIIRLSCGVSARRISVLFYLAYCHGTEGVTNHYMRAKGGTREAVIKGGAEQLCYKMIQKIHWKYIKTMEPVLEISRREHEVIVTTTKKTYYCNYVIIAIPPEQILDITFDPPLEETRMKVLNNMQEGHLIKFVATYKTAFWNQRGYSGEILSCRNNEMFICCDNTQKNRPSLTGYIGFPQSFTQSQLYLGCLDTLVENGKGEKNPIFECEILEYLIKYFGEDARNPISYIEKSWWNESYTNGCPMNCPGLGMMKDFHEIRRPIGRLFWAGTETATQWNGFMEGAIQAGYRAAIEVLYDSRPSTLTIEDLEYIEPKQKQVRRCKNSLMYYITDWMILLPLGLVFAFLYLNKKTRNKIITIGMDVRKIFKKV